MQSRTLGRTGLQVSELSLGGLFISRFGGDCAEKGPLPPDVLQRLNAIAAMAPFRPCEERPTLCFGNPAYRGPGPL